MNPYLNSKFDLLDRGSGVRRSVVFGSHLHERGSGTFRRWMQLWLKHLVAHASGAFLHKQSPVPKSMQAIAPDLVPSCHSWLYSRQASIYRRIPASSRPWSLIPAPGPRTKLFRACNGAFRFDIQLALFLLPYLVQNVVSYGSDEARSDVQKEVCILRGARLCPSIRKPSKP